MASGSGSATYATRTVRFASPFSLGSAAELFPAGDYQVETADELVERCGHTARIRLSTVLIVPTRAGTRHCEISAAELEQALLRDSAAGALAPPNENPDRGGAS